MLCLNFVKFYFTRWEQEKNYLAYFSHKVWQVVVGLTSPSFVGLN